MVKDHSNRERGNYMGYFFRLEARVLLYALSHNSIRCFNVHIQSKLLQHMPVMGTHSSYQLGCVSKTEG